MKICKSTKRTTPGSAWYYHSKLISASFCTILTAIRFNSKNQIWCRKSTRILSETLFHNQFHIEEKSTKFRWKIKLCILYLPNMWSLGISVPLTLFPKKNQTNKMLIFFIDLKITHLKDKHFAKKNIHQNGRRNIEMLKFGNFIPFGPFLLS
jgi:hypothetical protein